MAMEDHQPIGDLAVPPVSPTAGSASRSHRVQPRVLGRATAGKLLRIPIQGGGRKEKGYERMQTDTGGGGGEAASSVKEMTLDDAALMDGHASAGEGPPVAEEADLERGEVTDDSAKDDSEDDAVLRAHSRADVSVRSRKPSESGSALSRQWSTHSPTEGAPRCRTSSAEIEAKASRSSLGSNAVGPVKSAKTVKSTGALLADSASARPRSGDVEGDGAPLTPGARASEGPSPGAPAGGEQKGALQVALAVLALGLAAVADWSRCSSAPCWPTYTPFLGIQVSALFTLREVRLGAVVLDMRTVPVAIVALLLAIGVPTSTAWVALVGTPGLCPLHVLIVFFGMAYVCVSLDGTGLLRHVALKVAVKTDSPRSVFGAVAGLSGCMTLLTSNDIVVLTLTPVIVYLCAAKGFDPYPFLYLQFVTANVWSVSLVIGNPTNLIVADAAGLNFDTYLEHMALAGIAGGIASVAAIYVFFRSELQRTYPVERSLENGVEAENCKGDKNATKLHRRRGQVCAARLGVLLVFATLDSLTRVPLWMSVGVMSIASVAMDVAMDAAGLEGVHSSCWSTVKNMPWAVAPFVLSLFFMVEVLDRAGVVATVARFASVAIGGSRVAASFGIGTASMLACQCLNNQPMTVLFTKVLVHPDFDVGLDLSNLAQRAIIVGSNLGANVTLIGSLAGPMWAGLLKQKSLKMNHCMFMRVMTHITPLVAFVAFGTLLVTQ